MKMVKNSISFDFVEKQIRKKTFGILTTISPKGRAQSTGILYGVSPPNSKFSLYLLTSKDYKKVENIQNNPYISFFIPFPHYFLRFVPASYVSFQGKAEIIPHDDPEGLKAFSQKRILKMNLEQVKQPDMKGKLVIIKLKPNRKLICYGLGLSLMKMRKEPEIGSYTVNVPPERL